MMKRAPFRKNTNANRGETAEKAVQAYLEWWALQATSRDYERLVDTKAAGRIIKAAAADFEAWSADGPTTALIEVKETEHEYRLDRSRLTQMPRLRKRAQCGVLVFVLIYHSTIKKWRCMTHADFGEPSVKGSWDLRNLAVHNTPGAALAAADALVFDGG